MKTVSIGSAVQIKDEHGVQRNALVTNAWPATIEYDDSQPVHLCLNVVYVSADEAKQDCYGRQTEHQTSCMHRSTAGECPGRFWWQE